MMFYRSVLNNATVTICAVNGSAGCRCYVTYAGHGVDKNATQAIAYCEFQGGSCIIHPVTEEDQTAVYVTMFTNRTFHTFRIDLSDNFGAMLPVSLPTFTPYKAGLIQNEVKFEYIDSADVKKTLYLHSESPFNPPSDEYYRMGAFQMAENVLKTGVSFDGLEVVKLSDDSCLIKTSNPPMYVRVPVAFRFCMLIGPRGIALVKLEEGGVFNLYYLANGRILTDFLRGEFIAPIEINISVVTSIRATPFTCCNFLGVYIDLYAITGLSCAIVNNRLKEVALNPSLTYADLYKFSYDQEDMFPEYKTVAPYIGRSIAVDFMNKSMIYGIWKVVFSGIDIKFMRMSSKYIAIASYRGIYCGVIEDPYNVVNILTGVIGQVPYLIELMDLHKYILPPDQVRPIFVSQSEKLSKECYRVYNDGRVIRYNMASFHYDRLARLEIRDNRIIIPHLIVDGHYSPTSAEIKDALTTYCDRGQNFFTFAKAEQNVWITINTQISKCPTTEDITTRLLVRMGQTGHVVKLPYPAVPHFFGRYLVMYYNSCRVAIWKVDEKFSNIADMLSYKISPMRTFAGTLVSISSHMLFACPLGESVQMFRLNLCETNIATDVKIANIFHSIDVDPHDVYYYVTPDLTTLRIVSTEQLGATSILIPGSRLYLTSLRI